MSTIIGWAIFIGLAAAVYFFIKWKNAIPVVVPPTTPDPPDTGKPKNEGNK